MGFCGQTGKLFHHDHSDHWATVTMEEICIKQCVIVKHKYNYLLEQIHYFQL